jgi:DNA-directed RNA polymerase subunit omega
MLLYPSQDKLLERIDSKYSLVILAAKRAHMMREKTKEGKIKHPRMLEEYKSVKNVGQALEEIAAGDLVIDSASISTEEN